MSPPSASKFSTSRDSSDANQSSHLRTVSSGPNPSLSRSDGSEGGEGGTHHDVSRSVLKGLPSRPIPSIIWLLGAIAVALFLVAIISLPHP